MWRKQRWVAGAGNTYLMGGRRRLRSAGGPQRAPAEARRGAAGREGAQHLQVEKANALCSSVPRRASPLGVVSGAQAPLGAGCTAK